MNSREQLFGSLVEAVEGGGRCALCTVVSTRGSTPQTPGAMLLLHGDGRMEGTIGGGCVEAEVRKRAMTLLAAGESAVVHFKLDHDYGWDDGLICGGNMDVAVTPVLDQAALGPFRDAIDRILAQYEAEIGLRLPREGKLVEYRLRVEATPTLLIAGAGHVGAEVARLATGLDYRVVVIDDRAELLSADRLPSPIEGVAGDIAATLGGWPIDGNTYVVIVTRGHNHDEQALHAVIDSPAKYIGMIGSRRKVKLIFDDLAELGVDRARLERVYSPIGLMIGAVTVPEIAVSILAELTQVRRAGGRKVVEGPIEIASA